LSILANQVIFSSCFLQKLIANYSELFFTNPEEQELKSEFWNYLLSLHKEYSPGKIY
jgi:hypothetical protein